MIEAEKLTKRFGGRAVVEDVTFTCEPGTVTGFLGPNGAGKTTTMRMICGFATPDSGSAGVLGAPYRQLANPGRRVGVLLDASAQHGGRRGREALTITAQTMGTDEARVDYLLERVGLDRSAARKRVRQYSLGMRQRLGIANALIGEPEVLILDEPANGLDPAGIAWLRGMLRRLAAEGRTVVVASHVLGEVAQTADHVVIVNAGEIRFAGPLSEIGETSGALESAFLKLTAAPG
jgi:ABC-2 type transport system ATP-binding protein